MIANLSEVTALGQRHMIACSLIPGEKKVELYFWTTFPEEWSGVTLRSESLDGIEVSQLLAVFGTSFVVRVAPVDDFFHFGSSRELRRLRNTN